MLLLVVNYQLVVLAEQAGDKPLMARKKLPPCAVVRKQAFRIPSSDEMPVEEAVRR